MRVITSLKCNITVLIKAQLASSLHLEILQTALTSIELLFELVFRLSSKIFKAQLTPGLAVKNVTE